MEGRRLVLLVIVAAFAVHVTSGQLVTGFQICEMQQMKQQDLQASGLNWDDPKMVEIREYCLKHAYDHLNELGK